MAATLPCGQVDGRASPPGNVSYRLKEKRKAGLLTRSEPYTEAGAEVAAAG